MGALLLRTIIIYIVIIFALRVMGKRQLGELQPSELVVTILVSNIATMSLEDIDIPLLGTVLPILMLVSCEVLVSVLILKNSRVRKIVTGNPCIIIRDGMIDQNEMKNLRWTIDDVMEQLRVNSIFDISEVAFAVVETSGTLSAQLKFGYRPVTAHQLSIAQNDSPDSPPVVLISDGEIVKDSLNYCGVDEKWLEKTLKGEGYTAKSVFLMTCDKSLKYYIVQKGGKN